MILFNGTIYIVDDQFSVAQALAIKDGKIAAVGNNLEILEKYSSAHLIDLNGKPVYPGFIDAHCHFVGFGINLISRVDLTGSSSMDEVLQRISEYHQRFPDKGWIEGRGWDQNLWPDKTFPNNRKLSELFPDIPVILIRIDGHAALANKKALQLAGITASTRVNGGEILLTGNEPNGILIDNAIELVTRLIPPLDYPMMREALMAAQQQCFSVGLTSVHDAGLEKNEITILDSLQQLGQLKMRLYAMLTPSEENLETFLTTGIVKTDNLHIRSIKLYADGALGSRGAKLLQDYHDDPGNSGLLVRTPESLDELCRKAYDAGFQVCTHAIGDSANRLMLHIYAKYLQPGNDLRWRIEHAQVIAPEDFTLFGTYRIIPSVQPTHATSDMYWAPDRLGQDRIRFAYAYRQLLHQNGWMPLGTDFPVEHHNPILTFYAAVARKDRSGWPPNGFQIENALSRPDALRGMTIWAARAAFEENEKGSLEPGKLADLVILDRDIMQVPENEILETKVLTTILGGQIVYEYP